MKKAIKYGLRLTVAHPGKGGHNGDGVCTYLDVPMALYDDVVYLLDRSSIYRTIIDPVKYTVETDTGHDLFPFSLEPIDEASANVYIITERLHSILISMLCMYFELSYLSHMADKAMGRYNEKEKK